MPLCTEPGQTFPYAFPCDRAKAEATRPTVLCRALSARDGDKWFRELLDCKTYETADAKMAEVLVGVTNMGEIRDVSAMLAKITQTEREDLATHLWRGLLTEGQRKNS
jgi:hypothetical protein